MMTKSWLPIIKRISIEQSPYISIIIITKSTTKNKLSFSIKITQY